MFGDRHGHVRARRLRRRVRQASITTKPCGGRRCSGAVVSILCDWLRATKWLWWVIVGVSIYGPRSWLGQFGDSLQGALGSQGVCAVARGEAVTSYRAAQQQHAADGAALVGACSHVLGESAAGVMSTLRHQESGWGCYVLSVPRLVGIPVGLRHDPRTSRAQYRCHDSRTGSDEAVGTASQDRAHEHRCERRRAARNEPGCLTRA